jgi:hypothetical protein
MQDIRHTLQLAVSRQRIWICDQRFERGLRFRPFRFDQDGMALPAASVISPMIEFPLSYLAAATGLLSRRDAEATMAATTW